MNICLLHLSLYTVLLLTLPSKQNNSGTFSLMWYAVLSGSVVSDSLWHQGLHPARLLCPWRFSRQEYWSELPCLPPGDLPNPEIKPGFPELQADSLPAGLPRKPLWCGNLGQLMKIIFNTYSVLTPWPEMWHYLGSVSLNLKTTLCFKGSIFILLTFKIR